MTDRNVIRDLLRTVSATVDTKYVGSNRQKKVIEEAELGMAAVKKVVDIIATNPTTVAQEKMRQLATKELLYATAGAMLIEMTTLGVKLELATRTDQDEARAEVMAEAAARAAKWKE